MATKTIELAQVVALRDHHVREVKKYEAAIATFRDVEKMIARAGSIMGKVAKRVGRPTAAAAAADKATRHAQVRKFLAEHPLSTAREIGAHLGVSNNRGWQLVAEMKSEVERVGPVAKARYRLKKKSAPKKAAVVVVRLKAQKRSKKRSKPSQHARQRAAEANGTRPLDIVRRLFVEQPKETTFSREDLLQRSGLIGTAKGGPPNLDAEGQASRMLGLTLSRMLKSREIKRSGDGFVAWHIPAPVNGSPVATQ